MLGGIDVLFKLLRYKLYQKQFCKQFVERSKAIPKYEYFLKHIQKKESIPTDFINVALYDVLDNNGMNHLIKKIYKLKKSGEYNVDTPYIKHSFKKVNYINSNITGTSVGCIADIELNSDKWIKKINISYTYINASEAVIQYNFCFRKVMSTYLQIHRFVIDSIFFVKKKWYFHTYADRNIVKNADYVELLKLDDIFFSDILQGYICTLFYTKYGVNYKLPIEYAVKIKRYNKKKAKKLKNLFLRECYQKGKEHMAISTLNYDRFELMHFETGKYFPDAFLLRYFSDFSTEMYFKAFRHIELTELEKHMRKYLNSRKTFVSAKDIKWLVNKIRYINEQEEKLNFTLSEKNYKWVEHLLKWDFYMHTEKQSDDFINYPRYTNYFLNLYEQNLEYLNSIASVQNNKIVVILTVLGLIATIVGIIISVWVV